MSEIDIDARENYPEYANDDEFMGRDPDPEEHYAHGYDPDAGGEDPDELDEDLGVSCAWCGSHAIEVLEFDHGIDPDCGYHDQGEVVICHSCGRSAEVK